MSNANDRRVLLDGFSELTGGIDSGRVPILLQRNQLSYGINTYLRGGFLRPRPGIKKINLTFGGNSVLEGRQKSGRFQVAGYYKPDSGPECLLASIGGRQFRFNVATDLSVQEITIQYQTTTTADFVPPAIGVNVNITVATVSNIFVGTTILINGKNYSVEIVTAPTDLVVKNIDDDGSTNPVPSGSAVISYDVNPSIIDQAWEVQAEKWWILRDGMSIPFIYDGASSRRAASNVPPESGREIGPGRMMAYGMGRIWGAEVDDRSFSAGDLVGGSSGTEPGRRDAVLKKTENAYLNNSLNFVTPASSGAITGMRFVATLDTSLGQGPLQVLTPNVTFSVEAPLDRTLWASVENPVKTISLISKGGLSHYGSILANGDLIFRAVDGIRSLILARREFSSFGNTPMSREMSRVLDYDDRTLLKYSSATVFDNRLLMTASPLRTQHGIYHRALVSLDFDLISSLAGKLPPVYSGADVGLNVLQIVSGEFLGVERCFIFCLNYEQEIELYEVTRDDKFDHQEDPDNDVRINWLFETPSYRFDSGMFPERKRLKRLNDCVFELSNVIGTVNFKVYYKPDSYPCWIHWKDFEECATYKDCDLDSLTGCLTDKNFKPQYRPRISLGNPPNQCDETNGRPTRDGYSFQVRVEVEGYCEIRSMQLVAEEREENYYGKIGC